MKNGDLTMYNKIILKGITISDLGECHENFKVKNEIFICSKPKTVTRLH